MWQIEVYRDITLDAFRKKEEKPVPAQDKAAPVQGKPVTQEPVQRCVFVPVQEVDELDQEEELIDRLRCRLLLRKIKRAERDMRLQEITSLYRSGAMTTQEFRSLKGKLERAYDDV